MQLLDAQQIQQKIKRLAIEILENNADESQLILAGVNENGHTFARLLQDAMREITLVQPDIQLVHIRLVPAAPLSQPVEVSTPLDTLNDKVIIVVDDVANTGRTLHFAMKPLLDILPKKIELAVLVDRKHKQYPVQPKYVGLELATTLRNNIDVQIGGVEATQQAVYLN